MNVVLMGLDHPLLAGEALPLRGVRTVNLPRTLADILGFNSGEHLIERAGRLYVISPIIGSAYLQLSPLG